MRDVGASTEKYPAAARISYGTPDSGRGLGLALVGAGGTCLAGGVVLAPVLTVAATLAVAAVAASRYIGLSIPGLAFGFIVILTLCRGALEARGLLPGSSGQITAAASFAAGAFVLADRAYATRTSPVGRDGALTGGAIALVVFAGIGVLNPVLPSLQYGVTGFLPFVIPVVLLFAARNATLTRADRRWIVLAFATGWGVNLFFALRQSFVGFTPGELEFLRAGASTYLVGDDPRLLGAFKTNQDFGLAAAIALPTTVALTLSAKVSRTTRAVLIGVAAATAYVLVASLLRSILVGGVIGALLVVVLASSSAGGRRRTVVGVFFVVTVVAALGLTSTSVDSSGDGRTSASIRRVSTIFSFGQDEAFQARTSTTWPRALAVIGDYPLGAGPGAAGPVSQTRLDAPFGTLTPDNGYLLITVQTGIQGLVAFLVFTLGGAARLSRRGRAGNALAVGAAGALVAVLVSMGASGLWGLVGPISLLCLIVGLASRSDPLVPSSPRSR